MIKQYTPSQIFQLHSQSPADIQDALISERTSNQLRNITLVKHKLSVENLGVIARLVALVLFGLLHPDELATNLQKELNIEPAQAKALYRDIWEAVLRPVEGSLRRIHGPIKAVEEIEIKPEFKPAPPPLKPPIAKIEEIKKEAIAPPPIRPTPPQPIKPITPPPVPPPHPKKEAYLEPIEEETRPIPPPIRPVPPKPLEAQKIEIGGIPVEVVPKKEAPERPITPPRISALYVEPTEEEETPPNVVDLREK